MKTLKLIRLIEIGKLYSYAYYLNERGEKAEELVRKRIKVDSHR